ncbi:phage tail protein [Megalodesulfovibrio paquesii]
MTPAVKTSIRELALADLLPGSIAADPTIQTSAAAVQGELAGVTAAIDLLDIYADLSGYAQRLGGQVLDAVAWGWHVDLYDLLESTPERLEVTRRFVEFHRLKGTKAGLALYFRTFLKRNLLAASPPTKSYLGGSLTADERAAWLAPHPEVRVYPYRHAGVAVGAHVGDTFGYGRARFLARGDALLRIGDQVTLYDPKTARETPLHSLQTERQRLERQATRTVQVALPGDAGRGDSRGRAVMCGGLLHGFLANLDAASRYYLLEQAAPYADELDRRRALAVQPSLEPVRVGYELVAQPGHRSQVVFLGNRWTDVFPDKGGACLARCFPHASRAADRIYRRTRLFDPARNAFPARDASLFLGAFRLGGFPAHHGEAAVDLLRPQSRHVAFVGRHFSGRRFLATVDAQGWIDRMRRVGREAVRLSDKIDVRITNRRTVTCSASLKAGATVVGERQLEVV